MGRGDNAEADHRPGSSDKCVQGERGWIAGLRLSMGPMSRRQGDLRSPLLGSWANRRHKRPRRIRDPVRHADRFGVEDAVTPRTSRRPPSDARGRRDRRDEERCAATGEPTRRPPRSAPFCPGSVRLHRRRCAGAPVSDSLGGPPSTAFGVATFYHYFRLKPQGEHHLRRVHGGRPATSTGPTEDPGRDSDRFRSGAGSDDRRWPALAPDGPLFRLVWPCAPRAIVDGDQGRVDARQLVMRLGQL